MRPHSWFPGTTKTGTRRQVEAEVRVREKEDPDALAHTINLTLARPSVSPMVSGMVMLPCE
jgi:hypothetical protein